MALEKILAIRTNKTIYMDKNQCVKVFQQNYPKDDILNEALNQARVEKTEIRIPRILGVMMVDGKWAIISEFIKGKTIKALMNEEDADIQALMDKFVDTQLFMHSCKNSALNHQKDKLVKKINESDLREEIKFDLLTRLSSLPSDTYICHGDYNPENVIINPKGIAYTIDWSHVTQGNVYGDIARSYLLFVIQDKKDLADLYLKTYNAKKPIDLKEINKWLPIIAASELNRTNEKEREILRSWVMYTEF